MAKVKIQGHASGTGILTITAPNTSTDRTITLPDSTGTLATTADVPSSITDNGDATAITIDSSENVLIGKTTTALATAGLTLGESGFASITRDGYEPLNVNRLSSDGNVISVYKDSVVKGSIAVTGSGIGIQLGGTAAANTLDDYEEGTWTPTVATGTISAASEARYTKVGKLCNVTCILKDFSDKSTNAQIRIRGLPFTQGHTFTVGTVIAYQNGNSNPMGLITGATTSEFKIFYLHSASSWGTQNHNTLGGDPHFYLSGVYETT